MDRIKSISREKILTDIGLPMTLNPLTPYEDAQVAAAVKRWTGARKDHAVTGAATQEEKKDFTTDLH